MIRGGHYGRFYNYLDTHSLDFTPDESADAVPSIPIYRNRSRTGGFGRINPPSPLIRGVVLDSPCQGILEKLELLVKYLPISINSP